MVISSSDVGMTSSRDYSGSAGRCRAKTVVGSDGRISISLGTFQKKFNQTQFFGNNNTASTANDVTPTYSKSGIFNEPEIDNLFQKDLKRIPNADTEVKSTNSRKVSSDFGISGVFDEVRTNLFTSIFDFLNKLRFRGMFYYDNSSSLYITNSTNPGIWTVRNTEGYYFEESECTTFSTTGKAVTADGRELEFNLDVQMSREYAEYTEISYVSQFNTILTDPLVINLNSNPVSISDQTFAFDIDMDGKEETISQMHSSSGFLALDKNNDGIINDGSELFGAKTGNGFKELAEYDSDGNGWIDEADEIYGRLKVWIKDENGNDKLLTLKEADVGAIYLGNSKTEFSITDENNNLKAQVRSTGIYLHENGVAGSINQVDF